MGKSEDNTAERLEEAKYSLAWSSISLIYFSYVSVPSSSSIWNISEKNDTMEEKVDFIHWNQDANRTGTFTETIKNMGIAGTTLPSCETDKSYYSTNLIHNLKRKILQSVSVWNWKR